MSMIAMQSVIARLCVDGNFRRRFTDEPEEALGPYELTAEERDSLRALDLDAVQDYASSLVSKKVGLIKKWLPLSLDYLERELSPAQVGRLLRGYSLENIRDTDELGGEWVRGEFEKLCQYLREKVASGETRPPYIDDLIGFEEVTFSMELDPDVSRSAAEFADSNRGAELAFTEEFVRGYAPVRGGHVRVGRFDFDVAQLVASIEAGEPTPQLEREETWVLFFKIPHSIKAETHAINPPLKELLEMCDGGSSVREIVAHIAGKYAADSDAPPEELEEDCLQILEQLYGYGAIRFVPKGGAAA